MVAPDSQVSLTEVKLHLKYPRETHKVDDPPELRKSNPSFSQKHNQLKKF